MSETPPQEMTLANLWLIVQESPRKSIRTPQAAKEEGG